MAITYDAPSNTITVDNGTFDFEDIYNADVAGAWGVVSKQENQYLIEARLTVGNGNITELSDNLVQVQIGTAANSTAFKVIVNATFQLGLTSTAFQGNSLTLYNLSTIGYIISYGTINLYGCSFHLTGGFYRWMLRCVIDWRNTIITTSGDAVIYMDKNATGQIVRSSWWWTSLYGMLKYNSNVSLDDVSIIGGTQAGLYFNFAGTKRITNSTISDSLTYAIGFGGAGDVDDMEAETVDCDYNIYKIYTRNGRLAILTDFKTLKFKITTEFGVAIQGVTVTISDIYGTDIIETTDVNGDITEQELKSFFIINKGVGDGIGIAFNTYTFYTPYTVTIKKAGYQKQELTLDLLRDDWKSGVNLTTSLQRISINSDLESL